MQNNTVNQKILMNIVEKLVAVANPTKIIVCGSYSRNELKPGSDIDLLVIEEQVENKGKEMVRLRNEIGNIGIGVDVLVYTQKEISEWGHLPGTALNAGLKEGLVIYETTH